MKGTLLTVLLGVCLITNTSFKEAENDLPVSVEQIISNLNTAEENLDHVTIIVSDEKRLKKIKRKLKNK